MTDGFKFDLSSEYEPRVLRRYAEVEVNLDWYGKVTIMGDEEKPKQDIRTHVRGDSGGWWVVGKSPKGQKKLGPYADAQSAIQRLNELNATLTLQGRYAGPLREPLEE